jgi:hypothetical protein
MFRFENGVDNESNNLQLAIRFKSFLFYCFILIFILHYTSNFTSITFFKSLSMNENLNNSNSNVNVSSTTSNNNSSLDDSYSSSNDDRKPLLQHANSAPSHLEPPILDQPRVVPENHLVPYDFEKPTLKEYLLHEHTITSLYYGESHLVHAGNCCCCIKISKLRFRKRVFLFAWSILFVLLLSLEVQFGLSNWFYQWLIIIFAMPVLVYILKVLLSKFDNQDSKFDLFVEYFIYTVALGWTIYLIVKLAYVRVNLSGFG